MNSPIISPAYSKIIGNLFIVMGLSMVYEYVFDRVIFTDDDLYDAPDDI
jgi:hypothetical protein